MTESSDVVSSNDANDSARVGPSRSLSLIWLIAGAIAWTASFLLFLEYVGALRHVKPLISCTLNALVTCTPNMQSPAGNLLGFSNSIIGVTLFTAPIFLGIAGLGRVHLPRWYWRVFSVFVLAAFCLVHWFAFMSVFVIGVVCPWCSVIWAATITIFWFTLAWGVRAGLWGRGERVHAFGRWLYSWAWVFALLNYALIVILAQAHLHIF